MQREVVRNGWNSVLIIKDDEHDISRTCSTCWSTVGDSDRLLIEVDSGGNLSRTGVLDRHINYCVRCYLHCIAQRQTEIRTSESNPKIQAHVPTLDLPGRNQVFSSWEKREKGEKRNKFITVYHLLNLNFHRVKPLPDFNWALEFLWPDRFQLDSQLPDRPTSRHQKGK